MLTKDESSKSQSDCEKEGCLPQDLLLFEKVKHQGAVCWNFLEKIFIIHKRDTRRDSFLGHRDVSMRSLECNKSFRREGSRPESDASAEEGKARGCRERAPSPEAVRPPRFQLCEQVGQVFCWLQSNAP